MNVFRKWMAKATPEEKIQLAQLAQTSVGSLHQIAGGYRSAGKANVRPEMARRIELASTKLARNRLPAIRREQLCEACGRCEYAKQVAK